MPTRILPCQCVNAYQDKMYGLGKRVKNEGKKAYVCTVCGKPDVTTEPKSKQTSKS